MTTTLNDLNLLCHCGSEGLCRHGSASEQREMLREHQHGDAPWRIARRHGRTTANVRELLGEAESKHG